MSSLRKCAAQANAGSATGLFLGVLAKTQFVQNTKTQFETTIKLNLKMLKLNLKTKKILYFANVMPVAKY